MQPVFIKSHKQRAFACVRRHEDRMEFQLVEDMEPHWFLLWPGVVHQECGVLGSCPTRHEPSE